MNGQIKDYLRAKETPSETWEVMAALRAIIGRSQFMTLMGVSGAQMDRYCRNPRYSADFDRNPLDRLGDMFRAAIDGGGAAHVAVALSHLLSPLGLRVAPEEGATPDKDSVEEELLDDFAAVNTMAALIQEGTSVHAVRVAKDFAQKEIEETFVKYCESTE